MQTEQLTLHGGGQREEVEKVGQKLPDVSVSVFPEALVVKAIDLCDLPRLVVPSEDGYAVLVPHFKGEEQRHALNAVVSSVDVVPQEQEVRVREPAPDLEKFNQVVELPVDVPADGDRRAHRLNVRLFQ